MRDLYGKQTVVYNLATDRNYWLDKVIPAKARKLAVDLINVQWEHIADDLRRELVELFYAGHWRLRDVSSNNPKLFFLPPEGKISQRNSLDISELCTEGIMCTVTSCDAVVIKAVSRLAIPQHGANDRHESANLAGLHSTPASFPPIPFLAEVANARLIHTLQSQGKLANVARPLFFEGAPLPLIAYEPYWRNGVLAPTLEQIDFEENLLVGMDCWIKAGFSLYEMHSHKLAHGDFRGAQVCIADNDIPYIIDLEAVIEVDRPVFLVKLTASEKSGWFLEQVVSDTDVGIPRSCNHDFYDWERVKNLASAKFETASKISITGSSVQAADIKAYALAFLDFLFGDPTPENVQRYDKRAISAVQVLQTHTTFANLVDVRGKRLEVEKIFEQIVQLLYQLCIIPDNLSYFFFSLQKLNDLVLRILNL